MLAALVGLADLLLDRRRAVLEAERARGFEASDRLKAAILSSLSHELKSPIAALRAGLTALTAPQAGLADEQRELLTDLDRQATRLDRMVGDLLALSRLEAGVELDTEPHGFADLVGASLHQLRTQLEGHHVVVRIPEDLPPVEGDEVQLGRVVTNLLENAIEWAPVTAASRSALWRATVSSRHGSRTTGRPSRPSTWTGSSTRSGRAGPAARGSALRSPSASSRLTAEPSAPRTVAAAPGSLSRCRSPACLFSSGPTYGWSGACGRRRGRDAAGVEGRAALQRLRRPRGGERGGGGARGRGVAPRCDPARPRPAEDGRLCYAARAEADDARGRDRGERDAGREGQSPRARRRRRRLRGETVRYRRARGQDSGGAAPPGRRDLRRAGDPLRGSRDRSRAQACFGGREGRAPHTYRVRAAALSGAARGQAGQPHDAAPAGVGRVRGRGQVQHALRGRPDPQEA